MKESARTVRIEILAELIEEITLFPSKPELKQHIREDHLGQVNKDVFGEISPELEAVASRSGRQQGAGKNSWKNQDDQGVDSRITQTKVIEDMKNRINDYFTQEQENSQDPKTKVQRVRARRAYTDSSSSTVYSGLENDSR